MRRLVIFRPEPGASATLARALTLGIDALVVPLFQVRSLAWEPIDPTSFDALLLTSANAIRYGGDQLALYHSLPVKAVGEATAAAARNAGFSDVVAGGGGVDVLLRQLPDGLRLIHLCGQDRHQPESRNRNVTPIPVYASEELAIPVDIEAVLQGNVAAVHSPRASQRLAQITARMDRSTVCVAAISRLAAASAGEGWQRVCVAEQPSDAALLALARKLCNGSSPK